MSQDYHRLLESHLLFTFWSQRAATVDILAPRMDPAQEGLGRAYSGVIFTGKGGGRILKFGSHTLLCTTLSPFFPSFFFPGENSHYSHHRVKLFVTKQKKKCFRGEGEFPQHFLDGTHCDLSMTTHLGTASSSYHSEVPSRQGCWLGEQPRDCIYSICRGFPAPRLPTTVCSTLVVLSACPSYLHHCRGAQSLCLHHCLRLSCLTAWQIRRPVIVCAGAHATWRGWYTYRRKPEATYSLINLFIVFQMNLLYL